jgi:putative DNA primase/helicase
MVETASAKRSATYRSGASGCDVGLFRDAERVADEGEQKKIAEWARGSQSLERLKAMWTLAKADLAVSPEELDTDPMLLNVENGTIELRNGALWPHRPEDLITKLAPVEFDPAAQAPRFYKFLKQILVEEELIAFVQRFLGYSLTGSTKERSLAVLHGVGKNGKSTLVELFQDLMGDYSSVAHPNTIMRQSFSDATAQYQLAELKGARFVSVSETKRGVELEEAVVKQITGSDTISARAPYGKPFTYRPQFKLWLSTNHKPEIPDGSEAIWDRMRLIPFTQRFEDGKGADTKLPDKLREELAGVLAWAVRGCVEWDQHGLGSAAAVERATSAYRAETDIIDRFFEDACVFGPEYSVSKKDLFESYDAWCLENGEGALTQNMFTRVMGERGVVRNFEEVKVRGNRTWKGIGLQKSAPQPPSPGKVPPDKSPANVGVVQEEGALSEDFQNFSTEPPTREGFSKNGQKVPPESKSAPRVVTTPLRWEEDGVEWEYVIEEESE